MSVERYSFAIVPSIQIFNLICQHSESKATAESLLPALVVGNPIMPSVPTDINQSSQKLADLPASEVEARLVANLLCTNAITRSGATKCNVIKCMNESRLIHLATHGLLDDTLKSGVPGAIALAPDVDDSGFLTAGEILSLKLNAELVILSACVTGLGRITGDGIVGLSRSLIAAGVPRLLVSLWAVSDLSTTLLMVKFHEMLQDLCPLQLGDVAKALSQAQNWLMTLTSEDANAELEKLKPYIYEAFEGKPRVAKAYINRYSQDIIERAPYPFSKPAYWAAFTAIGV